MANRWIGLGLLAGALTYLVFAIPFWTVKPTIAKRYAADYNAEIAALPETDLAWPLLRRVRFINRDWDTSVFPKLPPDSTSWDDPQVNACREHLRQKAEAIRLIHEASLRPRFGAWLTTEDDPGDAPGLTEEQRLATTFSYDAAANPLLMTFISPALASLRTSTRLLILDMDIAAVDGDGDRVVCDLEAGLRLAQIAPDPPTLVGALTGAAVRAGVTQRLLNIHARYPTLLTPMLRERAAESLLQSRLSLDEFPTEWERKAMLDFSQRVFSDIAGGNGLLTWEGWEALMEAGHMRWSPAAVFFAGPVAARVWGTRTDFETASAAVYDAAEANFRVAPWDRSRDWVKALAKRAEDSSLASRLPLGLAPSISSAQSAFAMIAFDLEIAAWVLRGRDPNALPKDVYTGAPVFEIDSLSGPIACSTGPDRVNNLGKPMLDEEIARRWVFKDQLARLSVADRSTIQGDWRLWPPASVMFGDGSEHPLKVRE